MNERRGPWYLLTGLIIGLAFGLVYAWIIRPTEYVDTSPSSLRPEYKDKYRAMIAAAYVADGDLVRARARLGLLKDADLFHTLAEQAQHTLASGNDVEEARALGLLAVALGRAPGSPPAGTHPAPTVIQTQSISNTLSHSSTQVLPTGPNGVPIPASSPAAGTVGPSLTPVFSPSALSATVVISNSQLRASPTVRMTPSPTTRRGPSPTPSLTPRPRPSDTPAPSPTPTPTQGAPFALQGRQQICDVKLGIPMLQIKIFDAANKPVPGVEAIITWSEGQDHFFTGLKPEFGPGYADFRLTPGVRYTLRLADGGQPVQDITAPDCEKANGEHYSGAWLLLFVQP